MDTELRYAVAPITNVDVRDPTGTDDNTWTMSGYAAVFNDTTTLYDGKFLRLTESIDPGFFDSVLRTQGMSEPSGVVHFNFGHDMNRAVAATDVPAGQAGSLQLKADSRGLFFLAKVPRDDPDGVALAAKMRSGVVKQASFAFTIAESRIENIEADDGPDTEHRTLVEARHLYDVCACTQGAYSSTVSGLRSYAQQLGQPIDINLPNYVGDRKELADAVRRELISAGGHQHQPVLGGANVVSPDRGGVEDITPPETAYEFAVASLNARAQRLMPITVAVTEKRNRDVRSGQDADDSPV